jgi:D-tyrosyl-tRNA(Tyr) deacylase
MTAVIQVVKKARVTVDGAVTGECGYGLMILLGVAGGDTEHDADVLADKLTKLRVFKDGDGKMNLSVADVGGSALVVSNFTLNADYKKGNRPSYFLGAAPDEAERLYLYFSERMRRNGIHTENGVFGAEMECEIHNSGPCTLVIDSRVLTGKA